MSKELININANAFSLEGLKVYNAIRSEPITEIDSESIWKILVKYYYVLGISKDNFPNDVEKIIIIDHLKKNHERLKIDELELVLNNYAAGKYPDLNHFGKISAAFLSAIIHRYQQQEKIAYNKELIAQRKENIDLKKEVKQPTGEEAFEMLKKIYVKGKYTNAFPYWSTVYDYLREQKKMVLSKEEAEKVMEDVKKYYSDKWFYQRDAQAKVILDNEDRLIFECRRKCVINYMEKN